MAIDEISALVKFCSAETALKILNSQTLRWSSPQLFSDPFELDHHSKPDFTPDSLLKGMIKEAINMLFGPTEPRGKSSHLVAAICRWREEERFASEEEAEQVLQQLLGQVAQQQYESINSYMAAWNQFSRSLRICSFSDKVTNMHAWQRYGENHAGIALRFSAGDGSSLPEPRRITYSTTPQLVTSLKQQIGVAYGRENNPDSDEFTAKVLSKNKTQNLEREWRCLDSDEVDADSDEELLYSNKNFLTAELKGVYFGLGSSRHSKEAVLKLVKAKYPGTKVYQAHKLPGRFEVDFNQMATR